ncbi:MAG: glycosyltransferase family 4 protein [Bacteroidota bacterium]
MGKILHIVNSVSYDGAAILSFRIAMMTPQYQHEIISMFKGSGINEFMKNGLVCSYLLDKNSHGLNFKLKKDLALVRYLLKNKYDIIHFHGGGISILFLLTLLKGKASLIFHLHSGNITGIPFKQKVPYTYKLFYRFMDSHITKVATCEHVREFYMQQIKPSKSDSIHLIRNFTPYEFCIRNKLSFRVGYIGRIASEKNVDLFFELCRNKKLSGLNLKFAMMGDVSEQFSESVAEIVSEGAVEYFPPNLKVEGFYEMIDILIFPSGLTETMPQVILEAVSFDTAVMALKSKATEEICSKYPALVGGSDIKLYVERIEEYYYSAEYRMKLQDIHKKITNKFNRHNYYSGIVGLYESLTSK